MNAFARFSLPNQNEMIELEAQEIRRTNTVLSADAKPAVTDYSDTIIGKYATSEDIATVQRELQGVRDAEADVERVLSACGTNTEKLQQARYRSVDRASRAAAVALGENVGALASGPTIMELEETQWGLTARLNEARALVDVHKGRARAAFVNLLTACAQRCADEYEVVTRQQARCHQQLGMVQGVLGNAARLVDELTWNRYLVPGSPYLLKKHQQDTLEFGVSVLMSADQCGRAVSAARKKLREYTESLFGTWPL